MYYLKQPRSGRLQEDDFNLKSEPGSGVGGDELETLR